MSDISLNICPPAETAHTREASKHRRKRKWLYEKRRCMEENNNMEGKQNKKHKRRKSGQKFARHQSGVHEEGTLFAAPSAKLFRPGRTGSRGSTGSKYECLTSTQNNIRSAPPSSTASPPQCSVTPSTAEQNKELFPSSSSTASSSKPSASEDDKGLPHASRAAGAPNCSHKPSASTHSLPSSNSKGHYDTPKELWNAALAAAAAAPASSATSSHKQLATKTAAAGYPTKYLAIDCEMVGAGPKGSISQLARCSVVNYEGDVVYDKYINPSMPVTDYRTRWSGIRRCDLINATPYAVARKEILKLLTGKVVIGHAVHNDFKVLSYSHPTAMTRDTARIPLLNQRAGFEGNQSASLKRLTKAIFNRDIQTGRRGHSSVEDARATMELYKVVEEEWERTLASQASSGPA